MTSSSSALMLYHVECATLHFSPFSLSQEANGVALKPIPGTNFPKQNNGHLPEVRRSAYQAVTLSRRLSSTNNFRTIQTFRE